MDATPAKQELHQLIDLLDDTQAERVLRLVRAELTEPSQTAERPWPASIGAAHSGLGDLASNPEKYFGSDFGR